MPICDLSSKINREEYRYATARNSVLRTHTQAEWSPSKQRIVAIELLTLIIASRAVKPKAVFDVGVAAGVAQ